MGTAGQKRTQEELLELLRKTPIAPLSTPNGAPRALDATSGFRHNGTAHAGPAHAETAQGEVADAVALAALSVATRATITLPVPEWLVVVIGLALVVIGIGSKSWATASLSAGTFYWRDFFVPPEHRSFSATGPY